MADLASTKIHGELVVAGDVKLASQVEIEEALMLGGINMPRIFVQSTAPTGAKKGDIWIQP